MKGRIRQNHIGTSVARIVNQSKDEGGMMRDGYWIFDIYVQSLKDIQIIKM